MTRDELLALMDHFSASVLHRMEYEEGDTRIVLEKAPIAPVAPLTAVAPAAVPAMAPAPTAPAATAEAPQAEGSVIKAPLVGTFYTAAGPDAAPFVQAGDKVQKGQTVCILEAMKAMSEIPAPMDCVIEEVLLDNGSLAAFDAPLFRVRRL